MITLVRAMELAQKMSGYHVNNSGDCGDKWVFGFEEFKDSLGGLVVLVDKKSGACEYLSSAEFVAARLEGKITYKPINLPID